MEFLFPDPQHPTPLLDLHHPFSSLVGFARAVQATEHGEISWVKAHAALLFHHGAIHYAQHAAEFNFLITLSLAFALLGIGGWLAHRQAEALLTSRKAQRLRRHAIRLIPGIPRWLSAPIGALTLVGFILQTVLMTGVTIPSYAQMAALTAGTTPAGLPIGTFFYLTNHLGSSTVILDDQGNVVETDAYKPFGELWDDGTAKDHRFYFTGKEKEEFDLYQFGARWYSPDIGRFISADSIIPDLTDSQQLNAYSYANNNPINLVDPTGHSSWTWQNVLSIVATILSFTPLAAVGIAINIALAAYNAYQAVRTGDSAAMGMAAINLVMAVAGASAYHYNKLAKEASTNPGAPATPTTAANGAAQANQATDSVAAATSTGAAPQTGGGGVAPSPNGNTSPAGGASTSGKPSRMLPHTTKPKVPPPLDLSKGREWNDAVYQMNLDYYADTGADPNHLFGNMDRVVVHAYSDTNRGLELADNLCGKAGYYACTGVPQLMQWQMNLFSIPISAVDLYFGIRSVGYWWQGVEMAKDAGSLGLSGAGAAGRAAANGTGSAVSLNGSQAKNLARFIKKLPVDHGPVSVSELSSGGRAFISDVPATNIPGSFARYVKYVDVEGATTGYFKYTYDAEGVAIGTEVKF